MLYLEPETVLDRIADTMSGSLLENIGDNPGTAKYNVILLRNTLRHVSNQAANRNRGLQVRRQSIVEILESMEALAEDETVSTELESMRRDVEEIDSLATDHRDCKIQMNGVLENAIAMVNDGKFGDMTDEARELIYDHFDVRVQSELDVLRGEA
jgi:hypothetical protein